MFAGSKLIEGPMQSSITDDNESSETGHNRFLNNSKPLYTPSAS